jgi:hypothetical protein
MGKSLCPNIATLVVNTWFLKAGVFIVAVAIGIDSMKLVGQLRHFPVSGQRYPIDAIHFMSQNNIRGRALVSYDWALYAIAALSPGIEVACDGRCDTCYPQEILDMTFDFALGNSVGDRYRSAQSGPANSAKAIHYLNPEIVLLDRRANASVSAMAVYRKNWILLYQDAIAQLWGRRDIYDNPASTKFVDKSLRRISDYRSISLVQWPAIPTPLSVGDSQLTHKKQT